MAGSKLKPLLINKYNNPHCFSHINTNNLPVIYKVNPKSAWMTKEIFTDWLNNHFIAEASALLEALGLEQKMVLFLDNASQHCNINQMHPNLIIMYLPPNTTCFLQPMDQSINHSLKSIYLRHLMSEALISFEKGISLKEFWKSVHIKKAIDLLSISWSEVKISTMQKAWKP